MENRLHNCSPSSATRLASFAGPIVGASAGIRPANPGHSVYGSDRGSDGRDRPHETPTPAIGTLARMAGDAIPVRGSVQHYAWGDPSFIPALLGVEADGRPWAELWLGTHPNGPSELADGTRLESVTGPLPYLLKVLAAAEPLSLQAHPDEAQARDGFARGIYPDDRAKPELLVALTDFDALCGLRSHVAAASILTSLGLHELAARSADEGAAALLADLYLQRVEAAPIIAACAAHSSEEAQLVSALDERYPGEPSVAATLLLNRVHLRPGEALHLTAGNLHAYLHGAGVELMGASDNVVRGGLTVKHVDVDELLRILDRTPLEHPVMTDAASTGVYPLPEAGVALHRLAPGAPHVSTGHELAIALDGLTWYLPPGSTWTPTAESYAVVPTTP